MSFNEALHSVCPSLSIKMALGIGLFNNALLAMGTERHTKYYDAAWQGKVCCRTFVQKFYRQIDTHRWLWYADYFHTKSIHYFHSRSSPVWQSQRSPTAATQSASAQQPLTIRPHKSLSSTHQISRPPNVGLEI